MKQTIEWCPPSQGNLKFNVDGPVFEIPNNTGLVSGNLKAVGIGGVLRNSERVALALFSKSVGMQESNVAELLAIREALFMVDQRLKTHGSLERNIIIESDSKVAVSWVNKDDQIPWK